MGIILIKNYFFLYTTNIIINFYSTKLFLIFLTQSFVNFLPFSFSYL
nr:MAG TPA: hypothetical protein [Bacteriophage sp.]